MIIGKLKRLSLNGAVYMAVLCLQPPTFYEVTKMITQEELDVFVNELLERSK